MPVELLPSRYGYVVYHTHLVHQGQAVLVIIEEYLGHRWLLLYNEEGGGWELSSQYALFESLLVAPVIPQRNATVVDVGVSLTEEKRYVAIEQDAHRWWIVEYVEEGTNYHVACEMTMAVGDREGRVWSERAK
jgi:hypothetical protein